MAEESGPLTEGDLARLDRIYVEPTNRCNLDCRTCMRHGWDEPLGCMDPGLFEKVMMDLNAFPGARNVFFGGFGEPLGHPRIAGMVARAKALGNTTELISNGIGLDDAMLGRLVAAGLDRLWVSIDGASPSSYADVRLGDHLPENDARQTGLGHLLRGHETQYRRPARCR
jgi:MoaA/NifB/PqqE/SkfB family radical SAM enzyme